MVGGAPYANQKNLFQVEGGFNLKIGFWWT